MVGFANRKHIFTLADINGALLTIAKCTDGKVFIEKVIRDDEAIAEYHRLKGLSLNGR